MTIRIAADKRSELIAESLSALFMALVVAAANGLHVFYILFPELGALSSDTLVRPSGKWAKEPWKLIATPTVAAIAGILISSHFSYGVLSILAAMTIGIGIVRVLRSAVVPAISAGVLPLVFDLNSWLYPLCIFATVTVLAGVLMVWRRSAPGLALGQSQSPDKMVVEVLESPPCGRQFYPALYLFVSVVGLVAQLTTWRFILFPPLIVIAYEMLGHPGTCPWAKLPFSFPVVCFLAALFGVQTDKWLGVMPISAVIVVVATYIVLKLFRLRMPPALAIGLIPFVMPAPTYLYALSVGIGTSALTTWFLLYRKLMAIQRNSRAQT